MNPFSLFLVLVSLLFFTIFDHLCFFFLKVAFEIYVSKIELIFYILEGIRIHRGVQTLVVLWLLGWQLE